MRDEKTIQLCLFYSRNLPTDSFPQGRGTDFQYFSPKQFSTRNTFKEGGKEEGRESKSKGQVGEREREREREKEKEKEREREREKDG